MFLLLSCVRIHQHDVCLVFDLWLVMELTFLYFQPEIGEVHDIVLCYMMHNEFSN